MAGPYHRAPAARWHGRVDPAGAVAPRPASLWEILVQRKLIDDDQILKAIAARFRFAIADLSRIDPKLQQSVPEQVARRFNVVPVGQTDSYLEIATANPFDIDAEKMLAFATGREVRMLLGSPAVIRQRIDELYRNEDAAMNRLLEGIGDDFEVRELQEDEEEAAASAEEASQRPIIRLVDVMLADGVTSRASDIHVEPIEGGVVVRYRIDGVLRQVMKIPRNAGPAPHLPHQDHVRARHRRPAPAAGRPRPRLGERRGGGPPRLDPAGLAGREGRDPDPEPAGHRAEPRRARDAHGRAGGESKALLSAKEGILLVTGPTGSGKTTTLYSAIRLIQSEGVNIVTVEDPVEYRLGENIVQVQVHEKAGLTFASALRSILRQDPDVVLIGEIRDQETAQIALQASLTGHLVLSTLHTNDAPNAVTRLVDMGMEPYKIASALRGVVAQRLMRRLCRRLSPADHRGAAREGRALHPGGHAALPRGRLRRVRPDRIPGPVQHHGGADDDAGDRAPHRRGRHRGADRRRGAGRRHAVAVGERAPARPRRRVDDGGAAPGHRRAHGGTDAGAGGSPAGRRPTLRPATGARIRRADPPRPAAGRRHRPAGLRRSISRWTWSCWTSPALPTPPLSGRGRGAKVLLVEDEEQLRRVMKDLLEREGYIVAEARDGVQALDEVDRHAPDIIVLDLNLPGLDGYSVLQQLRSRPATRGIPVMVLTAKGDEDNEVRVFELGADDFLTKPFRARALSARLEAVLGRHRA